MGHLQLPWLDGDDFPGSPVPSHHCLLEGVASGPAIAARVGRPAQDLPSAPSRVGDRGTVSSNGDNQYHLYYFTLSHDLWGWRDAMEQLVPSKFHIMCRKL